MSNSTIANNETSEPFLSDMLTRIDGINSRMTTVYILMIVITLAVILVLAVQAGFALYELLMKKKEKQEAPTKIVIQKSGRDSGKTSSSRKSGRSSRSQKSRSGKSGKSHRTGRSSRSGKKSRSTKSTKSSCSSSNKSNSTKKKTREFPSKKMMVDVEFDKDIEKDKKAVIVPPTVNLNIAAPPSYKADSKTDASVKSEASAKTAEDSKSKNTLTVSMEDKNKVNSLPVVSPVATPSATTAVSTITAVPPTPQTN